jgi:hypothetical protein
MAAPDPIPDLLKAVNEASGKAFALWITFLTVGIYLAIAIGTTTHLQLLLAGPVKLPLLGVDMPLFAFYGVAPPMFLVLHLYVLMQLYLLARLLRLFDDDLRAADMIEQDRRRVRGQLDKFVFTQFLIGAPQDGVVRLFLRAVVWLSFVVGPIILLVGFQLRFLPYHSVPVTYVHRVTLLLDIVLLALVWPRISRGSRSPRDLYALGRFAAAGLVGVVLLAFSIVVATVPGEWREDQGDWGAWEDQGVLGMFSRNLRLRLQRLVEPDEDKLSKLSFTLPLGYRDLRGANFNISDLRKADLRVADLRGANLGSANLGGALLVDAKMGGANLGNADLSHADLIRAKLSDADLRGANLSGAKLTGANLSGANLSAANARFPLLKKATVVSQEQLDTACGDAETQLPDGMTIKLCSK